MKSFVVPIALTCVLCAPLASQESTTLTAAQQELMEAAYLGQLDEVKRLETAGTAVDSADLEQRTPLMVAAFNGHTPVLQFLLDKGAKVDSRDVNGRTALMYASSGPFEEAVAFLLENGAEVDVQGTLEGFTALMTAASEGLLEVVRLLLVNGADPSLVDKDGDTAMSFAQQNGHAEVVALLGNPPKSNQ
jgi:ankyrin repeat protein